ncbi:hypothetical protein [Paenibacillus polymyxa]|uniref:hypothetical protein n=1 Tax=Paenibacillus polymyxa TaxID=1406 RepID=UPI001FD19C65|nr:hypothetical protein [Paenibacillus polymyxa]URJ33467.1 hypothetical protein MF625_002674 [Paenibacillus polymyxa]
MEIIFKPTYGMIKHQEPSENVALLLSTFIEEDSILLFSFYERNMHMLDIDTQKFISDRCVFVNSEWVLPWNESIPHWDKLDTPPKIIWFLATEIEEIIRAIEIDNFFRCIILKQGEEFKHYSNVLFHQEYYSSVDEEDYQYYLGFTNKRAFYNYSFEKAKKRFNISIID